MQQLYKIELQYHEDSNPFQFNGIHGRIQEFSSVGVQVHLKEKNSDKVFLSSTYLQRVQRFISKKTILFQGARGVQPFPGDGSNFFQGGGGGVQLLIPIEIHITCDFQGGSGPPAPL